ncbi:SAV_2336 N-terminal domain-related protein [Streptomyces sp. NPDC094034]|uniref:SAV_2336 N-terminal domain-related protein n=1 Tax=Streptomyces sp. NPDC094034 TaxID=3155309 RepID=UPI00333063E6
MYPAEDPPTPREVAELIWLARHLPDDTGQARTAIVRPGDQSTPSVEGNSPRSGPSEIGDSERSGPEATRLYLPEHDLPDDGVKGEPASPVRVAGSATLPRRRELARALRPLKRRVPSTVRLVVDEEATVSRIADHHHWIPILTPAADRWLDVLIVLDLYSESATFWEPLARELRGLFQQLGAFRDVRLRHLLPRSDGSPGLGAGAPTASQLLRSTGSAVDPTGRTVTLVLTDGVAPAWRTGVLLGALRKWAATGPTAILQALPEHVWDRTALAPEPGRFRTTEAGGPNSSLLYTGYGLRPRALDHGGISVPVLGIAPEWWGPWAHAIAEPAAFDGAALLLPASPASSLSASEALEGSEVPERSVTFEEFRAQAQPHVFRLAAYLAAAPLNLAVMRTVQSAMLPDSPLSDLAEIVYSGILRRAHGGDRSDDALSHAYEFVPNVRKRLLSTIRRDEADEVIAAVSAYLDSHAPATNARFTAAVPDPDGTLTLPIGGRHWAEVHNLVRRRQGRRVVSATPREQTAVDAAPKPTAEPTGQIAVRPATGRAGRRFIITVGVSRYEHPSLSDLPGVRRDVGRVRELFAALGYEYVLPELADDPQAAEVMRGLYGWAAGAELGPSDVVVVYFAGNATRVAGRTCLLAADSVPGIPDTTVPLAGVLEGLRRSRIGHLLLLLDTCLREPDAGDEALSELLGDPAAGAELSVLAMTVSYETTAGSRFTEALAHVLDNPATHSSGRYIELREVRNGMSEFLASRYGGAEEQVLLATTATGEQPYFPNPGFAPGAERYDVFVSYAHEDGEWPVALAGDLQRLGLKVWFDRWELAAGQSVAGRLRDGLAKADALVTVVSPRWIASDWCNEEFAAVMTASTANSQRVIPVLWGDVATVPPFIANQLFVDFRTATTPAQHEAQVQQLLGAVRGAADSMRPALDSMRPAASRATSSWLREPAHDGGIHLGQRDRFTLFGHQTDFHVFEGDGTRPIREDNVRIVYTPEGVEFPEEIAGWRRAIEDTEWRKEKAGRQYRWNTRRFAVDQLVVSRTQTHESPIVTLRLCHADYYDFMTTSLNLDRPQANGLTLRQQYLEGRDPLDAPTFMFCSFGVHVAVRTGSDGKMLFSHRSAKVAGPNRSRWNSSANVGMAANDDLGPHDQISLHAVARRALREQLAIQESDSVDLELLGFGLDLRNNQWVALFGAELHDLDEETLRRRWTRGIEDKWVHDAHAFAPADPDSVLSFLLDQPVDAWTPCAPALFYLALVRSAVRDRGGDPSGRLDVEAAERRVLRRLREAGR